MMTPSEFRNEPLTDFAAAPGRRAMEAALHAVGAKLGREFRLLIGGRAIRAEETFRSLNPSQAGQVVGVIHQAGTREMDAAVEAALQAYESWRWVPAEEGARLPMGGGGNLRRPRLRAPAGLVLAEG